MRGGQVCHDPVAFMLGDDRGSGDAEAARVPLDQCLRRQRQRRHLVAIDKNLRRQADAGRYQTIRQHLGDARHAGKRRPQDAVLQ